LWVLFTVNIDGRAELRMVRTDGQDMQTLYCTPPHGTIFGTQWSFDQRFAVFNVGPGKPTLYFLVTASGKLQPMLVPQAALGYLPRTWLDATHVYLVGYPLNTQSNAIDLVHNIYILDIQKGANQHDKDLQLAATTPQTCWNFDTNYDSTLLFLSKCTDTGTGSVKSNGPSTITSRPTTGGTETPLYSSFHAVTAIRTVTETDILMLIENTDGDTSQNGLWKIKTDGSGLTQLTSDTNDTQSLCPFTQYAWSNTSVNHKMYALQAYDAQSKTYGMYYGLLSGGTPDQFADVNNGTQLALVGWISM